MHSNQEHFSVCCNLDKLPLAVLLKAVGLSGVLAIQIISAQLNRSIHLGISTVGRRL